MEYPKTKEDARQQAIDWQNNFSNDKLYWSDLSNALDHFEKTGKLFKLTEEFKENGII